MPCIKDADRPLLQMVRHERDYVALDLYGLLPCFFLVCLTDSNAEKFVKFFISAVKIYHCKPEWTSNWKAYWKEKVTRSMQ